MVPPAGDDHRPRRARRSAHASGRCAESASRSAPPPLRRMPSLPSAVQRTPGSAAGSTEPARTFIRSYMHTNIKTDDKKILARARYCTRAQAVASCLVLRIHNIGIVKVGQWDSLRTPPSIKKSGRNCKWFKPLQRLPEQSEDSSVQGNGGLPRVWCPLSTLQN